MLPSIFKLEVIGDKNQALYTRTGIFLRSNNMNTVTDIELTNPGASGGRAGATTSAPTSKKQAKEEAARLKADNDRIASLNTLVSQAQRAMQSQNWGEAESAVKQLIAR